MVHSYCTRPCGGFFLLLEQQGTVLADNKTTNLRSDAAACGIVTRCDRLEC